MSFRIVRNSKFRHVFGQALKKEQCYDNIRITKNSWDSNFCAVNPKFLAIVTEAAGGGAFLVISLKKTGKLARPEDNLVAGHKGAVLDIQWSPFDDTIIASASDDAIVRVWQIPDEGLTSPLSEPAAELVGHERRVGLVLWHPSAQNILLSSGSDNRIIIWDVGTAETITVINHPDLAFHCAWSFDGSRLATTCKDKKIRIYDARSGEVLSEADGHEGAKPQRIVYMKNNLILTTGFSRMSERQYSLRRDSDLSKPIVMEVLDTSNGVMFPFYDPDVNLLYLCAKGDSNLRYFEITEEAPYIHYINTFQSSEPQRGMGWMPKRGCDVLNCEIARFYKLHTKGLCEVITFTVPRKSDLFQEDIYPETAADIPALSAEEWIAGQTKPPVMFSLREGFQKQSKLAGSVTSGKGLSAGLNKRRIDSLSSSSNASNNFRQPQAVSSNSSSLAGSINDDNAHTSILSQTNSTTNSSNNQNIPSNINKNILSGNSSSTATNGSLTPKASNQQMHAPLPPTTPSTTTANINELRSLHSNHNTNNNYNSNNNNNIHNNNNNNQIYGSLDSKSAEELRLTKRANELLNTKVAELSNELNRMKAVVLKHEVRLRDLEKRETSLLPDEV